MRLVRANDKNHTKATIIMLVFYKDLLSASKYADTDAVKIIILITITYFLSVKNVSQYCMQLLIVIIKTLLNTLNSENSYKEIVARI